MSVIQAPLKRGECVIYSYYYCNRIIFCKNTIL